jgi:hypothetical protein
MRSSLNLLTSIRRPVAVLALTALVVSSMTGCKFLKKGDVADAAVVVAPVDDAGAPEDEALADAAAAPTTSAKVAAKDPDQIPTPVDDEKMVSQITKSTYKAELDRVEKEVDGEK